MDYVSVSHDGKFIAISPPKGELTRSFVQSIVAEAYASNPTCILWDLTECSLASLTTADFQQIAQKTQAAISASAERKVAFVVSNHRDFMLMCRYTTAAFGSHVPGEYVVFMALDKALDWLHRRC